MNVIRDISVILLAAEAFLFALIPLALFGVIVYGVWRLMRPQHLPTWLRTARCYVTMGLSYVESAMRAVVRPVMAAHKAGAALGGWIRAARGREQ
ncbi:MAG: hypothetical protein PVJ55_12525 [Anaerolineae bacterium]|jgi:hypothetical protein